MEFFVNFILPVLVIVAVAGLYIWYLRSRRKKNVVSQTKEPSAIVLPKSAPVVPFLESISLSFYKALKEALPAKYIIYVNVPIEKLFDQPRRESLHMVGQYADFVVFTPDLMPILVIDLFDLSIVDLNRVNRIKNVSKEILRNSGIPVLDYQSVPDRLEARFWFLFRPL